MVEDDHFKKERKREREKERREERREKERKREREKERASEFDANMATPGNRLNFSHRFCPFCECAVFAWFTPSLMDCRVMVPGYRFWGSPIALQCFVHISDNSFSLSFFLSFFLLSLSLPLSLSHSVVFVANFLRTMSYVRGVI